MMEKIGPYEFLGTLGRGGMGTVYRGRHDESGEMHAVKVLASNFANEDHFRGRFESEIRALIKLDHANIVRIISYGQEDSQLFFSMELVEGDSLFQIQKKGHPFDWREILAIAKSVAKGLRHAHDRGIIHRDLKPGNLLMPIDEDGNQGEVKITDFGIAKRFGASQNTGDNVLGTMDFMSPEQAKGQPVTFRSDLYSLGTLMFTLLSGRPPFSANSVEESLRNLTRVPAPRISSVVPDVPPELDALIRKLMSKRPENRIQTAQALIYKIEEAEAVLLSSSQAKTSEINLDDVREETFDLPQPSDVATQVNTEQHNKKSKLATNASVKNHDPTVDHTAANQQEGGTSDATKVDYFNTVADQVRSVKSSDDSEVEDANVRGMLPLLLGLLVVLGLAGFGIYQAYRPPSVESLYSSIDASVERPNNVMEEIELFIKLYPDDSRIDSVEELQRIGSAIQHYNRLTNKLSIRSNIAGENRLSDVESQFLEIVELAEDDAETALAKMAALITVHENDPELTERDQACLTAVNGFRAKIVNDARTQLIQKLKKIRSAMDAAAANQDAAQAIPVYRSILELYQDVDWGRTSEGLEGQRLIAKAQAILKDLLSKPIAVEKPDDSEETQTESQPNSSQPNSDGSNSATDDDADGE